MVERWSSSQRKMLPMLAHYELPPLSTHKLCTKRTFVLGDGRVSLRGWYGARGRCAQAQGSGIRNFLWLLSQGRVSLEQRLGTALQTAFLLIISLSLLFLKSDLLDH